MNDKEIKTKISQGYIKIKVIFEMVGNPKEHVEKTLRGYIAAIKKDSNYIFLNEYYADCVEKEGLWSTFCEAEMLVNGVDKLTLLCINMTPATIEIIEPEDFHFEEKHLTYLYNDLLAKLHELGMIAKSIHSENDLLVTNINSLIRNCILLSLDKEKTAEEISKRAGIDAEHLQPFLDVMVKEKRIVKEEDKYHL